MFRNLRRICLAILLLLYVLMGSILSANLSELYPSIDLNNPPPPSPPEVHQEQAEKVEHTMETEQKAIRSKRKRMSHNYPPGLTKSEKANFRNKALYHSKDHIENKERKRDKITARYRELSRTDKDKINAQARKRYHSKSKEIKDVYKARKRERYHQLSPSEKKQHSQKVRKNLLKLIDSLSPEEREEHRLKKNMKERERKLLKKQEPKARG